jgi:hypothetical protein
MEADQSIQKKKETKRNVSSRFVKKIKLNQGKKKEYYAYRNLHPKRRTRPNK